MVEIGPELTLGDASLQICLGGCDELDVDRVLHNGAQPPHAFGLDDGEQLALQRQGERVDLVQEQGASRGCFKEARFGPLGIGEGAGLEAKQLRLQQRLRDGGAVHLKKRPLRPWAAIMNDPRHQPLPGASFPMQQHGGDERIAEGVERHQMAKLRAQGDDGGRLT